MSIIAGGGDGIVAQSGGSGKTTLLEEFNAGLPADLIHSAGVNWSATGGLNDGCLTTDGDGEWWYKTAAEWQATAGKIWKYRQNIFLVNGDRRIYDVAFYAKNPGASANCAGYRLDSDSNNQFYVASGGSMGGSVSTGVTTPRGLWLTLEITGNGPIIDVLLTRNDTNAVIDSPSIDLTTLGMNSNYYGAFGQLADGAGGTADTIVDNLRLTQ